MENNDLEQPRIVSSHDIHIDTDYADWIAEVKHRYRSAQVKAAVRVNAEKLLFNWQLGRDLVQKKAEERWGAGVVEQVSLDLQSEFPDIDGFSTSNLWFMKRWYLFYTNETDAEILRQAIGELQHTINQLSKKLYQVGKEIEDKKLYQAGKEMQSVVNQHSIKMHQIGAELDEGKLHQTGGEFPLPFALVPWRHHVEIITKCKSVEEAIFYIGQTIEKGLSRSALINCIKANLFEHQDKIINNFSEHLPALQSKLVQEVLKENFWQYNNEYMRFAYFYAKVQNKSAINV